MDCGVKIEEGRIINDFIEPNKCQYAIPVYQRNYEWSAEQCRKLFVDVELRIKEIVDIFADRLYMRL